MKLRLPQQLLTPRLVLRPARAKDEDAFVTFMLDEQATRHLLFEPGQKTAAGARALLEAVIASYDSDEPIFVLSICDRESAGYVGSCGLSPTGEAETVECFYTIVRQHWGKGYATEATRRLLEYVTVELNIHGCVAYASLENPASWRVAEKAGMRDAGIVACPGSGQPGKQFVFDAKVSG